MLLRNDEAYFHASVPVPVLKSVNQTPGLRLWPNLGYSVTCQATDSTYNGTMTLVKTNGTGTFTAGPSVTTTTKTFTITLKASKYKIHFYKKVIYGQLSITN